MLDTVWPDQAFAQGQAIAQNDSVVAHGISEMMNLRYVPSPASSHTAFTDGQRLS